VTATAAELRALKLAAARLDAVYGVGPGADDEHDTVTGALVGLLNTAAAMLAGECRLEDDGGYHEAHRTALEAIWQTYVGLGERSDGCPSSVEDAA
jgi:hypothetical protein